MYSWLSDALGNNGAVITANRRLARALTDQYAADRLAAGDQAWRSPSIVAWQDWLVALTNAALHQDDLPTRINAQQSQLLWERCLQLESWDGPRLTALVRLCRESRQRLADWQVSIRDVARTAQNEDHKLFAAVLGRYIGLLEYENWVDDAGLGELLLKLLPEQRVEVPRRCAFVGFDRLMPVMAQVHDAMRAGDAEVTLIPVPAPQRASTVERFDTIAAELRSAGAWARRCIRSDPNARIAIIANDLDQNADAIARHVREGATPGWQHGHPSLIDAVNVSYGQRLADYPAIAVALLLLRWLVEELPSTDVGLLLRTPLLGGEETAARSRYELRMRDLPDRRWTPSMVTAEFRGRDDGVAEDNWLATLAAFSKRRRELPKTTAPANWAILFDQVLRAFDWPGTTALDSGEFQLLNRWRELLNDFARLGLVSPTMSPRVAIARLDMMAGEIIYQPETVNAPIQLLGPRDASGLRFDGTWVTGMTTANWPPAGTPSQLVSRRLQEERGLPDCTPADTLQHAQQILNNLLASGDRVVCSYALHDDDAEQTLSDLLSPESIEGVAAGADNGLYASSLLDQGRTVLAEDRVPPVIAGEKIVGGAGIIQRQMSDPVAAFIQGRLAAWPISPQAVGIPPPIRGKLIHDALYHLYLDLPASDVIRGWQGADLSARIDAAVNQAFARHERNTDAVLQQLYLLERARIADLLRQFVALDGGRGEFKVASVEGKFEFVAGHIRLPLRFDRIDVLDNGEIAILDYKTGAAKHLLSRSGEVQEIQLFVYALAAEAPVSALALINVDSREISFDGAGLGFPNAEAWPELLQQVSEQIAAACDDLSGGDVRINIEQGVLAARPLNLLTRYTEMRHDHG